MNFKRLIKNKLKIVCSKNKYLSYLYYTLIEKIFKNESFQLINGVSSFTYQSDVYLRREIHRLEKALCMPFKKEKYSVDLANIIIKNINFASENTRLWAVDVISKYIIENRNKSWIDEVKFGDILLNDNPKKIPFNYKISNSVSYESLRMQFNNRRTVRWYSKKNIDNKLFENLITDAICAPSACNRIPFKFYTVLNNNVKASSIAKVAAGTSGYFEQINNIIIIVGDLASYESEKDRHAIYIDSSLATMNLIHLLQTNNIGSCCINWSEDALREREIRKLVNLKPSEKIIMLMSFGYVLENSLVPYSQKKLHGEVIKYVD